MNQRLCYAALLAGLICAAPCAGDEWLSANSRLARRAKTAELQDDHPTLVATRSYLEVIDALPYETVPGYFEIPTRRYKVEGSDPFAVGLELSCHLKSHLGRSAPLVLVEGGLPSPCDRKKHHRLPVIPSPEELADWDTVLDGLPQPGRRIVRHGEFAYSRMPPDLSSCTTLDESLQKIAAETALEFVVLEGVIVLRPRDARLQIPMMEDTLTVPSRSSSDPVTFGEALEALANHGGMGTVSWTSPIPLDSGIPLEPSLSDSPSTRDVIVRLLSMRNSLIRRNFTTYHLGLWIHHGPTPPEQLVSSPLERMTPVVYGTQWTVDGWEEVDCK